MDKKIWPLQGDPLAPFLFLLFAETIISFLNAGGIGLCGLLIPFSNVELREVEFANDTALYIQGDLDHLKNIDMALTTLCKLQLHLSIGTNPWHFGSGMKTLHYGIHNCNFGGSDEAP